MGKDRDDFYEIIRRSNRQRRLAEPATQQEILSDFDVPASPKKFSERLREYLPGLVLVAWTVIPLSLASVFEEPLWALWCLYPVFSPLIWFLVAVSKPEAVGTTLVMGIIGHLLLAVSLWYILGNFGGMGGYYVGFDVIGVLVILALLVYSALGSVITILLSVSSVHHGP